MVEEFCAIIPELPVADPELSRINLSSMLRSDVFIFVTVPLVVKLPLIVTSLETVTLANVTVSPVCNPVSTSVLTPLTANLTVPWEGEERTDAETIPNPNLVAYEEVAAFNASNLTFPDPEISAAIWADPDTTSFAMLIVISLSDTVVVIELSPENVKVSPVV